MISEFYIEIQGLFIDWEPAGDNIGLLYRYFDYFTGLIILGCYLPVFIPCKFEKL